MRGRNAIMCDCAMVGIILEAAARTTTLMEGRRELNVNWFEVTISALGWLACLHSYQSLCTGFSSEMGTKLRNWGFGQVGAG